MITVICKHCGKETSYVMCEHCGINVVWYNKYGVNAFKELYTKASDVDNTEYSDFIDIEQDLIIFTEGDKDENS